MPTLSKISNEACQAMSIKFNTMVYELQRAGHQVLVLSLGEAFFDIPLFPMESLPAPDFYHYSHSLGIPALREKLSRYFLKEYGIPIDYEKEILITAGSKAAIHFAFMSIVNPGDEVILFEPCWVSYPEQIKLCYGVPVQVPWNRNIYQVEQYITSKTKAIVINNPHNPTGYTYSDDEINYLLNVCKDKELWLLSDEAYSDFVPKDKFISPGSIDLDKRNVIIFNSISKNYGISGWRLGYVIGNNNVMNNILKINQHIITCPATILEYYVEKYFYDILHFTIPQIESLLINRRILMNYMDEIDLSYMPGEATFYFFISIKDSVLKSEDFCTKLLQDCYISTVPGIGYGYSCDNFIRVSFGTATMSENKRGLMAIKEMIEETRCNE